MIYSSMWVSSFNEEKDYDDIIHYLDRGSFDITNPTKGGAEKAINAKAPLDLNAVYSGWQANHLFLFNKGIKLDADGDYDYRIGKGTLLTAEGKTKTSTKLSEETIDRIILIDKQ